MDPKRIEEVKQAHALVRELYAAVGRIRFGPGTVGYAAYLAATGRHMTAVRDFEEKMGALLAAWQEENGLPTTGQLRTWAQYVQDFPELRMG